MFKLLPLDEKHISQFKKDMQEAFQQGAVENFGEWEGEVLPESHIDHSLDTVGSAAYMAMDDDELIGGAIVVIDKETQRNHLDFLYVKYGCQSRNIGQKIWSELERLYPETKVWITCTPYFEKRNIHFYINKCGFHATRFYNKYYPDPNDIDNDDTMPENEYFEGMFHFEKCMT